MLRKTAFNGVYNSWGFIPAVMLAILLVSQGGCGSLISGMTQADKENERLADELHTRGLMLYDEKRYKDAIAAWLKEIELAPGRVRPYNNIGLTYRKLGDLGTAVEFHEKAIKTDPKFGHAYYEFGLVYYDRNDYKRASELFLKAIELDYRDADVYYSLGQAYKYLKDYDEAIRAFEKAVKMYYNYPGAHYQLGETHRLKGDFEKAKMEFQREASINPSWEFNCRVSLLEIDAALDPSNVEAYFALGMFYKGAPDYKDSGENTQNAINAFKKVIELNPAYPDAHFLLGALYEKKGDPFTAEQEYLNEIEHNPMHTGARHSIERIRRKQM